MRKAINLTLKCSPGMVEKLKEYTEEHECMSVSDAARLILRKELKL